MDDDGYLEMSLQLEALLSKQGGFLGLETVRQADGLGVTVSYWTSLEAIDAWKNEALHREAQKWGIALWYTGYRIRICEVLRESRFDQAGLFAPSPPNALT